MSNPPMLKLAAKAQRVERVESQAGKRPTALERGDWLAVPLCILWGIGLWLWPFVTPGSAPGQASSGNPLSFLWELPLTFARYLLGG